MKKYTFFFDLDATITKQEILPQIAKKAGIFEEMEFLTRQCVMGDIPFDIGFAKRIELLKTVPISDARAIINNIELNEKIVSFIRSHHGDCFIITGNLDVWINDLCEEIGCRYFSSKAIEKDGYVSGISYILDKKSVVSGFSSPFVAVGDGANDIDLIKSADIGIAFGGVHELHPSLIACADHVFYDESELCSYLCKTANALPRL